LHLLVRHTALLRRLSSHSAHSTHFPFSNRFLEVPIYFYTEISKGYQRDSKLFLLENNFNSLMEQIIVQKQNSEKTKKIRHDMKNHLTNIRFLIDSGETTAAMSLLDQVTDNVKKIVSETIDTGNSFVDAVLLSKTALCREKDIDFSYSVQPLENIKIGAADLSSLLSNLLDNAVEAAAQTTEPFVRLTITKYNAYYTICVENSYMGKKSLKESVGALISTKSDKAPHGYGTRIISDIAQKYDGNYSWEAQESRFISTVIMII
ncbi:MAG: GHKL domain-containing protein, partial [Ruminococcaceae bacterium]|nr:GHKL domain-containing protein [Oscillospiraceae bacterium]